MKSIYGKLIVGFLVSILLSFSVAGYFSLQKNANDIGRLTDEELRQSSKHIVELICYNDPKYRYQVLNSYAKTSESSFTIYHNNHIIEFGHVELPPISYKNMQLLSQNIGQSIIINDSSMKRIMTSYVYDEELYIISLQRDVSHRKMIFIDSAMIAVFCMLIAGSITFLVIADIIVKPISRLTKATNELSKGNYRVRVNYTGNDEIARLNRSFNQMAQQLAKQEETRQQFVSDVSHEFQTPLTAIQGFATILKNESLSDEQRQKYADIILFHSKRLSTLAKNMLQLTLLDGEDVELNISEFSLIDQLNRVIDTQENLALSKDIEIEFHRPKVPVMIEADESRLEQVWINLINNAIKYTNEHGVVTIEVKKLSKGVEVSIQDTGVGMSKEAISHIFERFYRQEKSRTIEGNGLGLSIVKRIIDLHQGTIDVVSVEDGGSRFVVRLPQDKSFRLQDKLLKKG